MTGWCAFRSVPHAPRHPEQQQAAGEQEPIIASNCAVTPAKHDAQHQRHDDAPEDRSALLHRRQRRRR
jgi:hypothetical protein